MKYRHMTVKMQSTSVLYNEKALFAAIATGTSVTLHLRIKDS